jgi:hypothetical protein
MQEIMTVASAQGAQPLAAHHQTRIRQSWFMPLHVHVLVFETMFHERAQNTFVY